MASSLSRALAALAGIYRFPGTQQAPESVEVGLPVQLVHNVSREAEHASGFYAPTSVTVTTAGGGVQAFASQTRAAFLATTEVQTQLQQAGLDPTQVDTWLVGIGGQVTTASAANFSRLRLGVNLGTLSGSGAIYMLKRFDATETVMVAAGNTFLRDDGPETEFGWWTTPILLPADETSALLATATDGGAGVLVANALFHMWVGPRGVLPPGLA